MRAGQCLRKGNVEKKKEFNFFFTLVLLLFLPLSVNIFYIHFFDIYIHSDYSFFLVIICLNWFLLLIFYGLICFWFHLMDEIGYWVRSLLNTEEGTQQHEQQPEKK